MDGNASDAVFFDIGNPLGSPRVSPNGRLVALTVYRYVQKCFSSCMTMASGLELDQILVTTQPKT